MAQSLLKASSFPASTTKKGGGGSVCIHTIASIVGLCMFVYPYVCHSIPLSSHTHTSTHTQTHTHTHTHSHTDTHTHTPCTYVYITTSWMEEKELFQPSFDDERRFAKIKLLLDG